MGQYTQCLLGLSLFAIFFIIIDGTRFYGSSQGYTVIPHVPSTTRHLDLSDNNITEINVTLCSDLPDLESLKLNGNRLTSIPPYTFQDCSRLTDLFLDRNPIMEIGEFSFYGLTALERINLKGNFQVIHNRALLWLESLKSLVIQSEQLISLPFICVLQEQLFLGGGPEAAVLQIPSDLTCRPRLEVIIHQSEQCHRFPYVLAPSIRESVKYIITTKTSITCIDKVHLSGMNNLNMLMLTDLPLKWFLMDNITCNHSGIILPDGLDVPVHLPDLTVLRIEHTNLDRLPELGVIAPNLIQLHLHHNYLLAVSAKSMMGLSVLEQLTFQEVPNATVEIPNDLHKLSKLSLMDNPSMQNIPDMSSLMIIKPLLVITRGSTFPCDYSICWLLLDKNPLISFSHRACTDGVNDWNQISPYDHGCAKCKFCLKRNSSIPHIHKKEESAMRQTFKTI